MWAGTIGSVLGPILLEPSRALSSTLGFPGIVGPFLVAALAMSSAGFVLLVAFPGGSPTEASQKASGPLPLHHLGHAKGQVALAALVIGQVVMILIMAMTPVHLRSAGGGLQSIGLVIAAHTFGMYAISPLSGYLSDHFGRRPVILMAGVLLVAAGLVSSGAGGDTTQLALGLFLLGWGWNLGFVSGSALLTEAVPSEDRMRLQGFADSVVWASAAAAGLSSGVLLESVGFVTLCHIGALLALVPAAVLALRRW